MDDLSIRLLLQCSVIKDTDPAELRSVYEAAVDRLDLRLIDYQTIRDLVALSGAGDTDLHLLLIAMFISLYEGSVCLKLSPESLAKKLLPVAGSLTDGHIASILSGQGRYSELVFQASSGNSVDDPRDAYKPLILVADGTARYLYFQKYYAAERALKTALAEILSRKGRVPERPDALAAAVRDVLTDRPLLVNGAPAVLNHAQVLGVVMPALGNFILVSGGPGTGKTFIAINLLRTMARVGISPDRMRITAPTGRAAQKLSESVRRGISSLAAPLDRDLALASVRGETIHRLLGYSPTRNDFLHNRYNRIPAALIIVDEASMIDIVLLGKLLEAVVDDAVVVMLGDRNQLPSVEAGAVLSDLISAGRSSLFSPSSASLIRSVVPGMPVDAIPVAAGEDGGPLVDRVVILTESYRSQKRITDIAARINDRDESVAGEIPELDFRAGLPESGVWRIDPARASTPDAGGPHALLDAWAAHVYEDSAPPYADAVSAASSALSGGPEGHATLHGLFARLDEARILSPVRSGPWGTDAINRRLIARLGPSLDPAGSGPQFSGAPIIVTRNDYDRSLFNGDVGVIMKGTDGSYRGLFSRFEGFVSYPVETLPPHEPSFAITVHKSQGSEYGCVLLVLPEGVTDMLLTKEILYTGFTRAKRLVIVYAGLDVLRRAIRNRLQRESGIRY